jgi:hypothetical protein
MLAWPRGRSDLMTGGDVPEVGNGEVGRVKPRGRRRWVGLGALLVGALVVIASLWLHQRPAGDPEGPTSPSPEGTTLALTVESDHGHCPSTVYKFTADVQLPGRTGEMSYQWEGPNFRLQSGETAPGLHIDGTAPLRDGRPDPPIGYNFYVSGQVATTGDVVLHVLSPVDQRSAPIHIEYVCP